MKSFNKILVSTVLLTSLSAFAAKSNSADQISAETRNHLTISSVEVQDLTYLYPNQAPSMYQINSQLEEMQRSGNAIDSLNKAAAVLDAADVVVDKIINIGTKIWNVVEKGKPVASYRSAQANALPQNALRWDQLQNWQQPTSVVKAVVYKNLYGIEVVRFVYRIVLLYGGDVSGIGRYIGYASVEPLEMTTAYLYKFDAQAKVDAVYNMGSSANPVAGMLLNVNWTISTILKTSTESHTFTMTGNGDISLPQVQRLK